MHNISSVIVGSHKYCMKYGNQYFTRLTPKVLPIQVVWMFDEESFKEISCWSFSSLCVSLLFDINPFAKKQKKNDNDVKSPLNSVKYFVRDIFMDFGLDKCTNVTFKIGTITGTHSIYVDFVTNISEL